MAENSLILSKPEVEAILTFVSGIEGVHVFHADEPFDGLSGYVALRDMGFHDGERQEEVLLLQWRDAKPVKREDRVPVLADIMEAGPDGDTTVSDLFLDEVRKCIQQDGWRKYDDPKNRCIGFIKQVPVDSHDESRCMMIPLSVFKAMPDRLRVSVISWRDEHDDER
jgi:hypothetical protein